MKGYWEVIISIKEVNPELWIIFKKARDEQTNQPVIRFKGLTDNKLEVAELTEDGWNAIRIDKDFRETEFPL